MKKKYVSIEDYSFEMNLSHYEVLSFMKHLDMKNLQVLDDYYKKYQDSEFLKSLEQMSFEEYFVNSRMHKLIYVFSIEKLRDKTFSDYDFKYEEVDLSFATHSDDIIDSLTNTMMIHFLDLYHAYLTKRNTSTRDFEERHVQEFVHVIMNRLEELVTETQIEVSA
tara:strand:+ start:1366 stop:1860 length:495 start_codon:yes stop_codon:yes gene_type:complete